MIPAMSSIAARGITSNPWVLSVGRQSSPARGVSPWPWSEKRQT